MEQFSWWTELTHSGILISVPVLTEVFSEATVNSEDWRYRRLRDHYNIFCSKEATHSKDTHPMHDWITHIFEDFLGHDETRWLKGSSIPKYFSILSRLGTLLKPRRVLVDENHQSLLLLQADQSPRLGLHKGRRSYSQFIELLRRTNVSLGILTNGHQIRLVYAGLDHDAWTQWQVDNWFDEGDIRHQLDGFVTLLSPKAFEVKDSTFPFLHAVTLSRTRQADLADVLGDQIRQAVEILTSAIGHIQQKDATFLDTVQITPESETILTEKEVLNAIYLAATRLVMRFVILFFAEAKNLLPKDNPFYMDNYGLEGLYTQLLESCQYQGASELETCYSAWPRFFALSEIVQKGSEHEILPLKAYGGSLFKRGDAKSRDPALRALSLFESPDVKINNNEVFSILRLIKIGKTKVRQGRSFTWVSGPVDFTELRTEYIGMMYEGLLDYELKIVEKDSPKVILNIGNQPILPLTLLEPMDDRAIKNLFDKMKVEGESKTETDFQQSEGEQSPIPEEIHIDKSTPYGRALRWGIKAVEATGLIRRPRGSGIALQQYEERKLEKARSLIVKVLEPGEMYLVRWGGTRKGSGTFYTKPPLAVPTTQRTLEPLVYKKDNSGDRIAKKSYEILNIKICDPSVGSGTFLVAAARYLTEALYESILTHILSERDEHGQIINVPQKLHLSDDLHLETPLLKPLDDGWEDQMKARLKRLVVERCLFGVDLNGMAVELARLALWLETMDKDLPFEFLDHRVKKGNSLVGSWFCHFLNYPPTVWLRQDGTGKDKYNKAILRNNIIPELAEMISHPSQYRLYGEKEPPAMTLNRQLDYWRELEHTHLFDTEKREEIYHEKIENDPLYLRLKHQFDRWSSVWFWPSNDEAKPLLSPMNFLKDDEQIVDTVNDLKASWQFFHWELEFPEVFVKPGQNGKETGFDAIIGNPPWDIQKPNSQEFFSNFDPIYRTYGKQEALNRQKQMFEESPDIEKQWLAYNGGFKALSNYVRNVHDPYDVSLARGGANEELKLAWKQIRAKQTIYHCQKTPYKIQGSADLNLYKLFLEQCLNILKPEGRLGMIMPSGVYTDKGCTDIRSAFLNHADWEWLFVFENRMKLFDIDSRFKFGPLILTKGGKTDAVKCAFMRHDVKDWESRKPPYIFLPVEKIKRFSPNTLSFMEFKSEKDLQICEKIYGDQPLLGDQVEGGWNVKFAREFDMTNDSKLFTSRSKLEKMGLLSPQDDARDPRVKAKLWKNGFVCLMRGGDIHIFDPYYSEPETFISVEHFSQKKYKSKKSIVTRTIARSTDERTIIGNIIDHIFVTGNSLLTWTLCRDPYLLLAQLSSFVFDWILRMKVSANINAFYLSELLILPPESIRHEISNLTRDLTSLSPLSNEQERLKNICKLNAVIFKMFDLSQSEVDHILEFFPLVDRDLPKAQKLTTLVSESFTYLDKNGLDHFFNKGWELPDFVTEFDRPGIKIWQPEGGWEQAWTEAKAMLTEEEWKKFMGEIDSTKEEQERSAVHEKKEVYGQKKLEFE